MNRTGVVWLIFLGAMTLVVSVLWFGQSGNRSSGYIAGSIGPIGAAAPDPIFDFGALALDRQRWDGIIIHHLGQPAGDAERVHRLHQSYGYQGLGYHFLIGNGNGLGDGMVHVGYRWTDQLPGAHVARIAPDAARLNERTIAICLIGNGDRRPFTPRQRETLATLVRRLQEELDLPASAVRLHRDVAPDLSDPGRFFSMAELQEQLLP